VTCVPDDRRSTDAALIAASIAEPEQFAPVFERHLDAVFGYFARRLPRAEAADLTAEVFRLAFAARSRFDPTYPSARPWLYGFALNVWRGHLRSRDREAWALRRLASAPVVPNVAGEAATDDALDAARRWPAVAQAIEALPPDEREALLLLAWEELSYAEIALATRVPVGTVRSRINRARARLREPAAASGQPSIDRQPLPTEVTDHG